MTGTIWIEPLCGRASEYDAFWSANISWNTDNPDLTRCFQLTILLSAPCCIFSIVAAILAVFYLRVPIEFTWKDKSLLNKAKLVFAGLLVVVSFAALCIEIHYSISQPEEFAPIFIISSLLQLLAFTLSTWLIHLEYRTGTHTSAAQQLFWAPTFLFSIVFIRSAVRHVDYENGETPTEQLVYLSIRFALITCLTVLTFFADTSVFEPPSSQKGERTLLLDSGGKGTAAGKGKWANNKVEPCPVTRASFAYNLFFLWFPRFVYLQWKSPLTFNDLTDLQDVDKCGYLVDKFNYYWNRELERSGYTSLDSFGIKNAGDRKPSLFRALLLTCWSRYLIQNILRTIGVCITFLNPLLLRWLLALLETGNVMFWQGIIIGLGFVFLTATGSILTHHSLNMAHNQAMGIRSLMTALLYRKSLRLSNAAKKKTTLGEITNLMSVDTQKLQEMASISNSVVVFPMSILICSIMLVNTIGTSGLYGILVLVTVIPVVVWICTRKIRQFQGKQMKVKDKRIRTIGEILGGIKVLKLYSWEKPFEGKVTKYRDEELSTLLGINLVDATSFVIWSNAVYLVNFIIFGAFIYSASDNFLDPSKIFVTFSLVNILALPLMILPLGINWIGQGFIAMGRITKFLLLEESQTDAITHDNSSDHAIETKDASFTWEDKDNPFLKNIDFAVRPGELVAVVGQVGSGKSSLAAALLGEMFKVHGDVNINGRVSYVPQHAWIQNATLRNNIIFGNKKDELKYQDILDACALRPDLKILANGDMTEIGEKGINLSGGQKQRVSLARAVYQDTDIYLMDDPLSAVDAHVASHLFDHVVGPSGVLAHKTRILITHGVTYLPLMDKIFVMDEGKIVKAGTYQQLLNENGFFANFLQTYGNDESKQSEESASEIPTKTTPLPRRRRRRRSRVDSACAALSESHAAVEEDNDVADQPPQLITQELEQIGSIKLSVLKEYAKSWGTAPALLMFIFNLCFVACVVVGQIWLSQWSTDPTDLEPDEQRELTNYRFKIYAVILAAQVFASLVAYFALGIGCTAAARYFHKRIISRLLKVPMSFYDTTPLGRILNRCSKDIDFLDVNIPIYLRLWVNSANPILATFIIIIYSTPIFIVIAIPIVVIYVVLQRLYINTARQLKRIDAVRKSPVFSHYEESVAGATSIRAYGKVEEFIEKSDKLTDESQRAWYLVYVSARWLSITLESLGSLVIFSATLLALRNEGEDDSGTAGLSISYSLQISTFLMLFVRAAAELETFMVAAERVKEYSELDTEAEYEIPETKPSDDWPSSGAVQYDEYCTRYRPGLDLVLKDISFNIRGSEKIGVVGRTGAGKSSVALSLFRIIESSGGSITIDGVPINILGLHDLRSKLTIIPQDPVVFSGSLRFNVDPLSRASDDHVWRALEQAHLKKFVLNLAEGLEYECGENGGNLSVGQRQLVCLARALLRSTKILLLDEATSGVDLETDDLIQNTIRTCFKDCTVITIAHRINTIMDYDRVMVLDAGQVIEFDKPATLMENKESVFSSLVKQANVSTK